MSQVEDLELIYDDSNQAHSSNIGQRRTRNKYSVEEKLRVVQLFNKEKNKAKVSKMTGIDRRQIYNWIKDKDHLMLISSYRKRICDSTRASNAIENESTQPNNYNNQESDKMDRMGKMLVKMRRLENNIKKERTEPIESSSEIAEATSALRLDLTEENQLKQFPQLKQSISIISRMLDKSANKIRENNASSDRTLDESHESTEEDNLRRNLKPSSNSINIMKALNQIAAVDKLKRVIYYEFNLNKTLRTFIMYGAPKEKENALGLMWQLCYDDKVAEDVVNDTELYNEIKNLSSNKSLDESITKNAFGILWVLRKKALCEVDIDREISPTNKTKKPHIMISYNSASRDQCLKVKSELEKEGYVVWIDVEEIHGSSLESMARAIEQSFCVLMCMTEKYKQSANCRAEAEYAFNLNKPIIPLVMQKDYKPDGWLGIILGSKIYINFSKYDFEECMRRMKFEIQSITIALNNNSPKSPIPNEPIIVQQTQQVDAPNETLISQNEIDSDEQYYYERRNSSANMDMNCGQLNGSEKKTFHKA